MAIKTKNVKTLAYVEFMDKLIFVQNLDMIVSGEFDVEALAEATPGLIDEAEKLDDSEIIYYLSLITSDKESQSIAAYYKVIECVLKKMRENLK